MPIATATGEPHAWDDKTPDQVLAALVHELYPPVSALGDEVNRLSTGAFEDEELDTLIEQLRLGVNQLSRIVVALKRYTAARREQGAPPSSD
jgi:hypothetical protein